MLRNHNVMIATGPQRGKILNKQNNTGLEVGQLENQYQQTKKAIIKLLISEQKPIQIRLKEWLRKFQCVVQVEPWLRNRNLYCKVMHAMLMKNSLSSPFHKLPPTTSLPMLSLYQVPFDIRKQLEKQKCQNEGSLVLGYDENQKQNRNQISNGMIMEGGLSGQRSKQKYAIQNKIIHRKSFQSSSIDDPHTLDKEICNTVRKSYDFLLKNAEKFVDEQKVNDLLEELWNFTANP